MNHNRQELRTLPVVLVETTRSSGYRWCISVFHNIDWLYPQTHHSQVFETISQSLLRSLYQREFVYDWM